MELGIVRSILEFKSTNLDRSLKKNWQGEGK